MSEAPSRNKKKILEFFSMYIMFLNKPPKMHCNHTVTSGEKSLTHSTGALCKGFGFFPECQGV